MTSTANHYGVKLALVANCSTCGQQRAVRHQGLCPVCSDPLPAEEVAQVRAAVRARRTAFKTSLQRLEQRVTALADDVSRFATRGTPLSPQDHFDQVISPTIDRLKDPSPRIKQLLESGVWDPGDRDTIKAFNELIGQLDANLAWIASLRDTMPPAEWRAAHRELVRSAMALTRGQAAMTATIAAIDLEDALRLQSEAQSWFDQGTVSAERIARQVNIISDSPPDGPFQLDGSVDVAAAAWTGVGQAATTIVETADIVRQAFKDVPGVAAAADEHVVWLVPVLATSAWTVDFAVLVARAGQLRDALDAADAVGSWIADHALLVERILSGLDRIAEEVERLGREWRHGLPRHHVARSLTEVYRELVEGALCDLGGVVLIAARVARQEPDGLYEADVVEGIKAGDIVSEFLRLGPPIASAVDMLFRNASAHASITVTDTGITATQREIRNGRVVSTRSETLNDDEFIEDFVSLHEVLLALQLAILPWMTGHTDPNLTAAVATTPPSARQRDQTLALLAGLSGLGDVKVKSEGDDITIKAGDASSQPDADTQWLRGALSVVAGAFGNVPAPSHVTYALSGYAPVEFDREEFVDADGQLHTGVHLGLVTAKWLLESTGRLQPCDEATFVTAPLADYHLECASLALSDQQGALTALRAIRHRLDSTVPESRRSDLTMAVIEQSDYLIDYLDRLTQGSSETRSDSELQNMAQRAAASLQVFQQVAENASLLRDIHEGGGDAASPEMPS